MAAACLYAVVAPAQGIVTFNQPWLDNGISGFSMIYRDGFSFRVKDQSSPYEGALVVGAVPPDGHPYGSGPYASLVSTRQQMILAMTNAATTGNFSWTDGAPFGLVSVDLADPVAPSLAPISIVFNGFRADGSMITQTFTVGGGGSSSFARYQFNPEFASDLVRVEIPSPAWAMDNLVYNVPEPGTAGLFLLGLAALLFRRAGT
jgi:hypothetical protein